MGYGDNDGNSNASSPAIGVAPPPVPNVTVFITRPQKLLDLLLSDYLTATNVIQSLSRTQVRTLLSNANTQKIGFSDELFKLLLKIYEPVALELQVNIPSQTLGVTVDKDKALQELTSSGMLKNICSFLSRTPSSAVYPIYDNNKQESYSITVCHFAENKPLINDIGAQKAYDAYSQRTFVQESFPDILNEFLKKSNQSLILPTVFFKEITTLLIKLNRWALLSELLLRTKQDPSWFDDKTTPFNPLIDQVDYYASQESSPESLAHQRCMRILREQIPTSPHYNRNDHSSMYTTFSRIIVRFFSKMPKEYHFGWAFVYKVYMDKAKTIYPFHSWEGISYYYYSSDSTLPKDINSWDVMFSHLGRIERAAVLRAQSKAKDERTNMYLAYVDRSNPDDPKYANLEFFKDFCSDVFSYTTNTEFNWLSCVNLTPHIDHHFALISQRFSQIINWEMFDAAYYILVPLSHHSRLRLITSFTPEAWFTIKEFSDNASNLIKCILSTLTHADDHSFGVFLDEAPIDIFMMLLSLGYLESAQCLYENFQAACNKRDKFTPSIQSLFEQTEIQIETQITHNYKLSITQADIFLEKKIAGFIANPENFISLLKSHFILAYKYFLRMDEDQKRGLLRNAMSQKAPLIETLIEMNAFSMAESHHSNVKIPKPQVSESNHYYELDSQSVSLEKRLKKSSQMSGDTLYYVSYPHVDYIDDKWELINKVELSSGFDYGHAFACMLRSDYLKIATKKMFLDLIALNTDTSLTLWSNGHQNIANVLMGLLLHSQENMLHYMFVHSNTKLLTFLFTNLLGNDNEFYFKQFNKWLLLPHANDYPLRRLFESIGIDLLKGFLKTLDADDVSRIAANVLVQGHLSPESKRDACIAISKIPDPRFLLDFFNKDIAESLMKENNIIYARAIHELAPDFFRDNYVQFHLIVTEKGEHQHEHGKALSETMQIIPPALPATAPHPDITVELTTPPPPYTPVSNPVTQPDIEPVLLARIRALENQMMQQTMMMGQLLHSMSQFSQRPADAQIEAAHYVLRENTEYDQFIEKEKQEHILKNLLRFEKSVEKSPVRLKKVRSLSKLY